MEAIAFDLSMVAVFLTGVAVGYALGWITTRK